MQEEEEDESRPKKRGRYAKQDDDDFEPVSPLLPCLLPALLTASQALSHAANAYGMILGMQSCCPKRCSSTCCPLSLLSCPYQGLTVESPAVQEEDDEVGLFALHNSRNRLEHWHTYLLDD